MRKERFLEIVRFCIVGGLSLIVDCGVLYGLTDFVGNFQLLVVREVRFQKCTSSNAAPSNNFYWFKYRRLGIESTLHVVFRRNNFVALYVGETRCNGHCYNLELYYETQGN